MRDPLFEVRNRKKRKTIMAENLNTTTLTLAPIMNNQLATGLNAQTGLAGITNVATVELRELIDKAVKKQTGLLKAADKRRNELRAELERVIAALPTPTDLYRDAEGVMLRMRVFYPQCVLVGCVADDKTPREAVVATGAIAVNTGAKTYTASFLLCVRDRGAELCKLERTYPLPNSVTAVLAAVADTDAQISAIDVRIRELRDERMKIKEKAEKFEAAIVKHQMGTAPGGEAMLEAMKKAMQEAALGMGLSHDDLA